MTPRSSCLPSHPVLVATRDVTDPQVAIRDRCPLWVRSQGGSESTVSETLRDSHFTGVDVGKPGARVPRCCRRLLNKKSPIKTRSSVRPHTQLHVSSSSLSRVRGSSLSFSARSDRVTYPFGSVDLFLDGRRRTPTRQKGGGRIFDSWFALPSRFFSSSSQLT